MKSTNEDDALVADGGVFVPTMQFRWTRPKNFSGWMHSDGVQLQQLFREMYGIGKGREEWRPVPFIPED